MENAMLQHIKDQDLQARLKNLSVDQLAARLESLEDHDVLQLTLDLGPCHVAREAQKAVDEGKEDILEQIGSALLVKDAFWVKFFHTYADPSHPKGWFLKGFCCEEPRLCRPCTRDKFVSLLMRIRGVVFVL